MIILEKKYSKIININNIITLFPRMKVIREKMYKDIEKIATK